MSSDLEQWMILISLIVSGLSISVAAWFPRGKRLADWLMVAGGTMMPLGLIAMTIYYEVLSHTYYPDWIDSVLVGFMCGGAVLFAMGYAMDRVSRRQVQTYQATEQSMLPPGH